MPPTDTWGVQRRLHALGYSLTIDGIPGRETIRTVKLFQAKAGLVVDGLAGPKTIAALNAAVAVAPGMPQLDEINVTPPWIDNVRQRLGLQEHRDDKTLRAYLDSDGSTVGDPALIPWCGDLVQTALALTLPEEELPANPFYAINWAGWGLQVPQGQVLKGAIGTKKRFDNNGHMVGGHVFFVIGHDATNFHALGGNQNNSISIALIAKAKLNGSLRWPKTWPMPARGLPQTTIDATINASEA